VRFDGLNAIVRYGPDEKSATDQAMDQMNALRGYASRMAHVHPFIVHLVAFENLSNTALPQRPHNIIAGDQSFASILTAICEIKAPWTSGGRPTLSCCSDEIAQRVAELPIFKPIQPTALDRKRMERLGASSPQIQKIEAQVGTAQLVLRGHGGTGKTTILLQLAKRAYDEQAARSLILTYNRALAADIRRLMTLAAVPTSDEEGGVRVETVVSFVNRVCRQLGIFDDEDDPLEGYEQRAGDLAALLQDGDITPDDIANLVAKHTDEFRYDHVMIDEGQDWPAAEISIMRALYGAERLVIADGIDQFVREAVADWRAGVPNSRVVRLRECLRMKTNLARFANAIANELGAPGWEVQPSKEAVGGRVIVIEGRFEDEIDLHLELMKSLQAAGNEPIDCLYCVPHELVHRDDAGERVSAIAAMLRANNQPCWDGASADVRRDIPRDIKAVRVVQYHSCRGLEGWTVVAAALDEFWEHQVKGYSPGTREEPIGDHEAALRHAARWIMIPLSRAMDTLVVHINSKDTSVGRALHNVARRLPDVVEWRC
jgi:hypothetical protein